MEEETEEKEETKERKQRERKENERFRRKGKETVQKIVLGKAMKKRRRNGLQKMAMGANKNALWKAGRRE